MPQTLIFSFFHFKPNFHRNMANTYQKNQFYFNRQHKVYAPQGKILEPPLVTVQNVIPEVEGHMFDFSTTSHENNSFYCMIQNM